MNVPKKTVIYSDAHYHSISSKEFEAIRLQIYEEAKQRVNDRNASMITMIETKMDEIFQQNHASIKSISAIEATELLVNMIVENQGLKEYSPLESITDMEVEAYLYRKSREDWQNELSKIANTLDHHDLFVFGSTPKWDKGQDGWGIFSSLNQVLQILMKECEQFEIWDENGHLFLAGIYGDGRNQIEIRMLTDTGRDLYHDSAKAERSSEHLFRSLIENNQATKLPRYVERTLGHPAKEWEDSRTTLREVAKDERRASHTLAQNSGVNIIGKENER